VNILYFHQYFGTPRGAGGTRSYEMAQRLVKAGHAVTMICGRKDRGSSELDGPFRRGRREGFIDGIHVIEFDLPYSNHDNFLRRTWTFLKFAVRSIGVSLTHQYDLVFATSTPLTAGIPGIAARWLRHKPFVFEVRDLWPELPREMGVITNPLVLGAMSALEWVSYHSAYRLIGLSPGIVDGIARRGIARDLIALVPNGCDLDFFQTVAAPWRPGYVRDDQLLSVFTGAHGIANGLDAVIDAAIVLKQRNRDDICLLLVGDGKLKPHLQQRVQDEGLGNIVRFMDPIPKIHLAGLLAGADVGLQVLANVPAFYYGTSPNKFFDYLASGLPVLTNYPGWVADLITDNNCGFAVQPDNPIAFADALETAHEDLGNLKHLGANARLLAHRQFNRNELGVQFVQWIEAAAMDKK
jgi:glycosyltransferase involved in cell wall biosynthesis